MLKLNLKIQNKKYAMCQLAKDTPMPLWLGGDFFSVTKTEGELSIICEEEKVPQEINCQRGWMCLKIIGPIDLSAIGIISSLTNHLTAEKISVFVISTVETDYFFLKEESLDKAIKVLTASGHAIINV